MSFIKYKISKENFTKNKPNIGMFFKLKFNIIFNSFKILYVDDFLNAYM